MQTQRNKVLELLKNAGSRGVNSYGLTYLHAIKQAPTRIKELKEEGYQILSRKLKDRSVDYVLISEPKSQAKEQPKEEMVWVFDNDKCISYQVPK